MGDFEQSRTRMVDNQLRTNDVTDLRILDAMGSVPRERFVPAAKRAVAYIDQDLAVREGAGGRYLLKPHILGRLIQLAEIAPEDVVLVVGCSTGYSVAVAARLAQSVVGLEEDGELVEEASSTLVELGIENGAVIQGTLSEGCASEGPYDVILIDGAVEELPTALTRQLKDGGRLVAVQGTGGAGAAYIHTRSGDTVSGRFAFNAAARLLPGFARPKAFVF
ncbi:protein-L-isoaspartate O-methyltransferase [Stappia sp. F7233]|uniref:Protein-L-isoaspartate O-methyltransferase n=1 Tax=Stappia albiluteola TaxID=2758565 RepID=A0A839AC45_9HYPH|nr:protein-L-isoaspartate O-methyltransferase [Stappia albiluteola]MBA5776457.1 protein-L-isoaspartate O-methyltransferase [Stappia albiluteola]